MSQKQNNQYFTKDHENAILEYASIIDERRRTYLYINYIQPAFNEMVDKIVFTYKFNNLPNIDDLKSECKVWLTTILDKYDTTKGSKAFSYFSVITKNWFIHKVKKNSNKKEVYLEDIKNTPDEKDLIIYNNYDDKRELEEFWLALKQEMSLWETKKMKANEQKVYKAVKLLIEDNNTIEIFNKKAIYLYIREITGLNTKQVVCNLKKFKIKYVEFKEKWDNGEVTHISGGIFYDK
jgi:DNA-directed RNA polymerase specialized sigma subunit